MIVFGSTDGAHIRVFSSSGLHWAYYYANNTFWPAFELGVGNAPESAVRDLWRKLHDTAD